MELLQNMKKEAGDMLSTKNDKMSGWSVRLFAFGMPVLIYVISLLSHNDDGTPVADPDGIVEHGAYIVLLYLGFLIVYAATIALVIGSQTKTGEMVLDRIAHTIGLRSSPMISKNLRRTARTLSGTEFTPENLTENLRLAYEAEQHMAWYRTEPRWSVAGCMTRRLHRKVANRIQAVRSYATSEAAHRAAREKAAEILGRTNDELDEALVYFSVDGRLDGYALILAERYKIAGKDPLESQNTWRFELVGEHYSYAALLCGPVWVHESNLARGDAYKDDVLIKTSDSARASGTYKDTVANLWNADRWHMYHKPGRLVKAAKLLDRNRRGGTEHFVA